MNNRFGVITVAVLLKFKTHLSKRHLKKLKIWSKKRKHNSDCTKIRTSVCACIKSHKGYFILITFGKKQPFIQSLKHVFIQKALNPKRLECSLFLK